MMSKLPPTDSRNRNDIQLYEQGNIDEAEDAKNIIEEEQRRKRKVMEDGSMKW